MLTATAREALKTSQDCDEDLVHFFKTLKQHQRRINDITSSYSYIERTHQKYSKEESTIKEKQLTAWQTTFRTRLPVTERNQPLQVLIVLVDTASRPRPMAIPLPRLKPQVDPTVNLVWGIIPPRVHMIILLPTTIMDNLLQMLTVLHRRRQARQLRATIRTTTFHLRQLLRDTIRMILSRRQPLPRQKLHLLRDIIPMIHMMLLRRRLPPPPRGAQHRHLHLQHLLRDTIRMMRMVLLRRRLPLPQQARRHQLPIFHKPWICHLS